MDPKNTPNNVLVVDDSPANLQVLTGMLQGCGYKVRPIPSGELALETARLEPPDIVLLDINMPGMDGHEVCSRLKEDPLLSEIPVIFISALNEISDKVAAFRMGGADYITKPFHLEEVEARVSTHLALYRQARELRESYERLAESERLRDNLVHMIIHDMRTPLCVVGMTLGLLKTQPAPSPDESQPLVENASEATEKLIEMVNQLTDISRMEAGQMPIQIETDDLVDVLRSSIERVRPLARERRLDLYAPTSCMFPFDRDLVSRVLTNLLGNALKYSRDEITVSLDAQPDQVRIEVTDNGPGIAPEHQGKIFTKFAQAELRQKSVGTGLGLAFCKLAVEALGGEIGVISEPGGGSTFWFTLPSARS